MMENSDSLDLDQQPYKYKTMKVKKLAVFLAALGIVLYFADIISDILLAVKYYYNHQIKFFFMTLFLVLLSAVVSSIFSLSMYCSDNKNVELRASKKKWILRASFLIFGIAPVLRNVDALYFAWKSVSSKNQPEKHKYARRMIFEINDSSFLKLVEAFLESGPQLVLQIYIYAETQLLRPNAFTEIEIWQCSSMVISSISISCAVVGYLNSLRNSLDHKNELKFCILIFLFIWRFFEITSRVIAMGLGIFATPWFHLVFIGHFIVVTIWIYLMKTNFCDNRCAEKFYNVLMGFILSFVYLNPEDSPTRKRCLQFYLGIFAENTLAILIFWFYSCSPDLNLKLPAVAIQILSFCLSIILMVIYYKFLHPTVGKISKKRTRANISQNSEEKASDVLDLAENDQAQESSNSSSNATVIVEEVVQNNQAQESNNSSSNVTVIVQENGKTDTVLEIVQNN